MWPAILERDGEENYTLKRVTNLIIITIMNTGKEVRESNGREKKRRKNMVGYRTNNI